MSSHLCPRAEWEDDAAAASCNRCGDEFNGVFLRRHHCRLCERPALPLPPRSWLIFQLFNLAS